MWFLINFAEENLRIQIERIGHYFSKNGGSWVISKKSK